MSGPVKPLFHEIDVEAFKAANPTMTWVEVKERFRQPDWCDYPGALDGGAGCWSLVGGRVTGEDFCRKCDCHAGRRALSEGGRS